MKVKAWQVGAGLTVALAIALALVLWSRRSPPHVSGPWLVPADAGAPSRPSPDRLVRHYSEVEDACGLPDAEQLVRWHGLEFATDPAVAPERPLPSDVPAALRALETEIALSRPARAARPWVLVLPEVHEHEESEDYVLELARAAAHAFGVHRVRVFVEAWSQEVQVDHRGTATLGFTGLEPTSVYPWSRAAWSLLDLIRAHQGRADPITPETARRALVGRTDTARLRIGQHPSREGAKQALAIYARTWNALCSRFAPQASTRASLPVAADYLQDGRWVEFDEAAQLAIPSEPTACRPGSPLHTAALTLAAVTSRLRTTEFAIRVLETVQPSDEELALIQVGANHVFPLVDLLERAGLGWAVLLSPRSRSWVAQAQDWRCPVASLPDPLRTGLGYFRLPTSPSVRKRMRLWETVPLDPPLPRD